MIILEAMFSGWVKRIVVNASIDYMSKENLIPQNVELSEAVWKKPGNAHKHGEGNLNV